MSTSYPREPGDYADGPEQPEYTAEEWRGREMTLEEAKQAYDRSQLAIDTHLDRCVRCRRIRSGGSGSAQRAFSQYCPIAKMLVRVQDDFTELMVDAYNREMRQT